MVRPEAGEIFLETDGVRVDLIRKSTEEIVGLGIALVPGGPAALPAARASRRTCCWAPTGAAARADIAANLHFAFEAFPVLPGAPAPARGQHERAASSRCWRWPAP